MTHAGFGLSRGLFDSAGRVIAGGVTSAVRAGARPHPLYFERGVGSAIWDVDGNCYIDFALGYGPLILGHAPRSSDRRSTSRSTATSRSGRSTGSRSRRRSCWCGRSRRRAGDLRHHGQRGRGRGPPRGARCDRPAARAQVRGPLPRLARRHVREHRATTRPAPGLRHDRRSWTMTGGMSPSSSADIAGRPVERPARHRRAPRRAPRSRRGDPAGALSRQRGAHPAGPGFLEGLRELATEHGAVLVFDEVITGFRLALGGAQERYGITRRPRGVRARPPRAGSRSAP